MEGVPDKAPLAFANAIRFYCFQNPTKSGTAMASRTARTESAYKEPRVFRIDAADRPGARWSIYVPNGPQAAFEALALPTYPLTPMGVASLPGRACR